MGGDIGIAFVTTLIARRSQFHQSTLVGRTQRLQPRLHLGASRGSPAPSSARGPRRWRRRSKALSVVYRQVQQQALTLAFLDAIKALAIATALMLPLLFLTRRPGAQGAPAGGH